MKAQKYLYLLRKIKDVAFATVDEHGNPQVRIIDIMIVEDEKLYFVVSRGKEVYKQISDNPNIAITAMTKDYLMIRLNGKVKKADQKLLSQVFIDNSSMNEVYPGDSRNILDVFCIYEGYGEVFDLSNHPIYREPFSFGGMKIEYKGFIISNNCIECGACQNICPQKSIDTGTPYKIKQENCLHCGLCQENCPVDAINKL